MAGFRTFATGEVLTAANVNDFLMRQSVMVFADATARTTALGAEVAEGMLTYNEDTEQLEVYDGAAFVLAAPAPPAGIGSNVVSTVQTANFSTSSTSFVDITGLSVTITPTSDTSRVLVLYGCMDIRGTGGGNRNFTQMVRDSTGIGITTNRINATGALRPEFQVAIDSPASASAVTYKMQGRVDGSTGTWGGRRLIAIEVAA